jgi:hypothetical protein
MMTNNVNKKTKRSSKQCESVKKQNEKSMNKEKKAPTFNFSSIHLIHNNPQGMAENHFDFRTISFLASLVSTSCSSSAFMPLYSIPAASSAPSSQCKPHMRRSGSLKKPLPTVYGEEFQRFHGEWIKRCP